MIECREPFLPDRTVGNERLQALGLAICNAIIKIWDVSTRSGESFLHIGAAPWPGQTLNRSMNCDKAVERAGEMLVNLCSSKWMRSGIPM